MRTPPRPDPAPEKADSHEPVADAPAAARLAELVLAHAPYDGSFDLRVPGLGVFRRSGTETEIQHGVARSSLCIIGQGEKRVTLGSEEFVYDEARMIVYSVDLPVTMRITRASHAKPLLGLRLDLDPERIAGHVLKVFPNGIPRVAETRAIFVGRSDPDILAAAVRLMEMMARPRDAELLAPLVVDEILIRLLRGPVGARVAQIGLEDSGVHGVSRAITWLRENYYQSMRTEFLAELAGMSVSTFHHHFKTVTTMSPLQFQKSLRLQEARRLMLAKAMDAGSASRRVGYLSASQFSREYRRLFGASPGRDVARLRESDGGAVAG